MKGEKNVWLILWHVPWGIFRAAWCSSQQSFALGWAEFKMTVFFPRKELLALLSRLRYPRTEGEVALPTRQPSCLIRCPRWFFRLSRAVVRAKGSLWQHSRTTWPRLAATSTRTTAVSKESSTPWSSMVCWPALAAPVALRVLSCWVGREKNPANSSQKTKRPQQQRSPRKGTKSPQRRPRSSSRQLTNQKRGKGRVQTILGERIGLITAQEDRKGRAPKDNKVVN